MGVVVFTNLRKENAKYYHNVFYNPKLDFLGFSRKHEMTQMDFVR